MANTGYIRIKTLTVSQTRGGEILSKTIYDITTAFAWDGINYAALTNQELAEMSLTNYNLRLVAFRAFVSDAASVTDIEGSETNLPREINMNACPLIIQVYFGAIVAPIAASNNAGQMASNALGSNTLDITISYTIEAWAETIGKQEAITSTTKLYVSDDGGTTFTEIDTISASIPGSVPDESDYQTKSDGHQFLAVTDANDILVYGTYSYGVVNEDTGGMISVVITAVTASIDTAEVICDDSFYQEDGVTPNTGELMCSL